VYQGGRPDRKSMIFARGKKWGELSNVDTQRNFGIIKKEMNERKSDENRQLKKQY